jgi:hypothetical protein
MRRIAIVCVLATLSGVAHANDWEKYYRPSPSGSTPILPADQPPQIVEVTADPKELVDSMWRKGFAVLGVSSFNSPNASTKDALRFAEKIHAAYVGMATRLTSSQTANIPMTTPTTSTSYTNGNVSATGSGGYTNGSYSGTTTTFGSQTTYLPIAINRFDKGAIYFGPLAKQGAGLLFRAPTPDEVARYESRHLLIVQAVRDGSPADMANVLEGDVVVTINGEGATINTLHAAAASAKPVALHIVRNGQPRDVAFSPAQ